MTRPKEQPPCFSRTTAPLTRSSSEASFAVHLTFVFIFFPNSNWPRLRCRDLLSHSHFSEHKQPAFKTLLLICLHQFDFQIQTGTLRGLRKTSFSPVLLNLWEARVTKIRYKCLTVLENHKVNKQEDYSGITCHFTGKDFYRSLSSASSQRTKVSLFS